MTSGVETNERIAMGTLAEATSLVAHESGFRVQLDPAWDGWGPAGGYLAAIALRAAGLSVPAGHRPATLSCQFLSRAQAGDAQVSTDVAKPGASACVNVTLSQTGRRFFQAQVWTTLRTEGPDEVVARMPAVPQPDELVPLDTSSQQSKFKPVPFWANLERRPVEFREPGGPPPRERRLQRWYRFRDWAMSNDVFLNAARAALLVDANIWPTHWRTRIEAPTYAGPSLDLTVWFHDDPGTSSWLLVDADSDVARGGLIHGIARVWSEDGRLVATGGSQCLVVPFRG